MDEFKEKLRVIHLVRDPVHVAYSLYCLQTIPGKTDTGRLYLLDPFSDENSIRIPDLLGNGGRFDHDLHRCLWYWYEIEARIKELKMIFPDLAWYRIETGDLNNLAKVDKLIRFFNLPYSEKRLKELVGVKQNRKTNKKLNFLALESAKEKHDALLKELVLRYGPDFWR